MDIKLLLKDKDLFEDLLQRLTLDYNGDATFEQHEEDRLIVRHVVDMLNDAPIFTQAKSDFFKASDVFNGKTYKECLDIINSDVKTYSATNITSDYIDFNYGVCCLTIIFIDSKAKVSDTSIEIWDDEHCSCLGAFTLCDVEQRGLN